MMTYIVLAQWCSAITEVRYPFPQSRTSDFMSHILVSLRVHFFRFVTLTTHLFDLSVLPRTSWQVTKHGVSTPLLEDHCREGQRSFLDPHPAPRSGAHFRALTGFFLSLLVPIPYFCIWYPTLVGLNISMALPLDFSRR